MPITKGHRSDGLKVEVYFLTVSLLSNWKLEIKVSAGAKAVTHA
jgi:hypothetical protein